MVVAEGKKEIDEARASQTDFKKSLTMKNTELDSVKQSKAAVDKALED